jgi:hypothetical protein
MAPGGHTFGAHLMGAAPPEPVFAVGQPVTLRLDVSVTLSPQLPSPHLAPALLRSHAPCSLLPAFTVHARTAEA